MALEFAIDRPKDVVRRAIFQFAARRAFRVSEPWYLDGLRVESASDAPRRPADEPADVLSGMLDAAAALLRDRPRNRVYVDVELRRKRGQTIVSLKFGDLGAGAALGSALQAFLHDDAVYDARCPVVCEHCTTPVVNVRANYCGRCGSPLRVGAPPRPIAVSSTAAPVPVLPPLPVAPLHEVPREIEPREQLRAGADAPVAQPAVTVERDDEASQAALPDPGDSQSRPVEDAAEAGPECQERLSAPPGQERPSTLPEAAEVESAAETPAPVRRSRRAGPMVVED